MGSSVLRYNKIVAKGSSSGALNFFLKLLFSTNIPVFPDGQVKTS